MTAVIPTEAELPESEMSRDITTVETPQPQTNEK